MKRFAWSKLSWSRRSAAQQRRQRAQRRTLLVERLDERSVLSALAGGVPNPNETVNTLVTAEQLAAALVGPGVEVSNVRFEGGAGSSGSFLFNDPTVVGFAQGIILSSGNAADVVGPNVADYTSTDFGQPGDPELNTLSGFNTQDAAVLEFDFVPTANQVVFTYVFASDEYPEWVNTPYNDVFAFFVNGVNYATVRQVAGAPTSPFVPVAVNNINQGNPDYYPEFVAQRPDLFRPNYVDPLGGPSLIDLELDGLTKVLTFQAPVEAGAQNHMKLAIADASDGIYDSAVFIQAGSLVSNENPVADLSLTPSQGSAPLAVTAIVEGEDPNGLPLTYTIDWGDGTTSTGPLDSPTDDNEKTTTVDHTYTTGGEFLVTLTVSNGELSGTSVEDVDVFSTGPVAPSVTINPIDQAVVAGDLFSFIAKASGTPAPSVQWQVSTDGGASFVNIPGATSTTYSAEASLADDGNLYRAVFTSTAGTATSTAALLSVSVAQAAPVVTLDPIDQTAVEGEVFTFLAAATGSPAPSVQWQVSTDFGLTFADIPGATGTSYSAVASLADQGALYQAVFSNAQGVAVSNPASLTVLPLDVTPPAEPGVWLANDTGGSASDLYTSDGALALTGLEDGATIEYSIDGGLAWSGSFSAAEGSNAVLVRQVDAAGNASPAASLTFTLDTVAPAAPAIGLVNDTGSSASDLLTNDATLALSGLELAAIVEYSADNGMSWTGSFATTEGTNAVRVRQTDLAGNISAAASLAFTLDTTPPVLSPSLSAAGPILVGAAGITASPNATDAYGVASQSAGSIDTATAGSKSVDCQATDLAGNSASASLPYVVGYAIGNLQPAAGATFNVKSTILVSFQLADANGLLSNQAARGLRSKIVVTVDGQPKGTVKYHKTSNRFSIELKLGKLAQAGAHTIGIHLTIDGVEVTTALIPINLI